MAKRDMSGTVTVVGELPTTTGSGVTFAVTWARSVQYPALWFTCTQDGVKRYAKAVEPLTSGTASFGIPDGPEWFNPAGGKISCKLELKAYVVKWKPAVVVQEIITLAELSFDVAPTAAG